jgi:flagellar biosynthesis anti-sigma factor FlgM
MDVDRISISNQGIDRAQSTQPSELTPSSDKDPHAPTGSDSVALSSKAKELDQLANAVVQPRAERLEKVREELESGSYQVSATDIAQKLIDGNKK